MYLLPQQIKLFEALDDPELIQALDSLPLRNYRKGLDIFQQGEASREVYGILRGRVEILHRPRNGELQQMAVLEAGDFFGEFSYLTGAVRSASAVATEDTVLLEISEAWLKGKSNQFESLKRRLADVYRTRVLSNVLKSTRLFSLLDDEAREAIAREFQFRRVGAGEVLIREGDRSEDLLTLKSGSLEVTKSQNNEDVFLGEIQSGEVVGEMALVTGQPRSATVTAVEDSEVMILQTQHFRKALGRHPELLQRLHEIVEFRASKTREILDSLADELAPDVADEAEGVGGLGVTDLDLKLSVQAEETSLQLKLEQISSQTLILSAQEPVALSDGSEVKWAFSRPRRKSLKPLAEAGPFEGVLFSRSEDRVEIKLGTDLRPTVVPFIQSMAKAKLQGLVYPEYPIEEENVFARVLFEEGPKVFRIRAASQTGMRMDGEADWPEGETRNLKLFRDEKEIFEIPVVCLSQDEGELEVQYEYDSEESKNAVEQFLRTASGAKRAQMALEESKMLKGPAPKDVPVLSRTFRSPQEFVKTYMSTIDQGFLKVKYKDPIGPGTRARVFLTILDRASRRKAVCEGIVKSSKRGEVILDLHGHEGPLRERLQRLCQKIIDEKAQTEWKGREATLREASYTVSGNIPDRVKVASVVGLFVANVILYIWIYVAFAVPRY